MNGNHDLEAAAKQLESLAEERRVNIVSGIQLSRCTKASDWPDAFNVVQMKSIKQLVFSEKISKDQDSAMNHMNEVVAHVQGIIWRHDLPPFRNQAIERNANKAKYLRQGVSLTGLGTPTFDAALSGILDVYSLFSRHVPRDKLKPCSCIDAYGEFTSIESSNRYFTSIKDCGLTEKHITFSSEIDPYGILTSFENSSYIHSDNNIVEYFERTILDDGEKKYMKISPVRFQIGDIVEVQMTFTLVPVFGNEYKMVSILRSMTMLDSLFSQKAFASKAASKLLMNLKPTGNMCVVKRRTGYDDEERASIRLKMSEMVIEDAENEMNERTSEEGVEEHN
ncbi:hypothetical protein F5887DRAFT_1077138 [Amanita rubescens]|nr:hypothetical protein F5887DRAFT_1083801 [Amanita rubescens]KAF8340161.1 hypothetical protein F5887DRAFT_1077138 [Amanita rubescens]